MPAKIWRWHYPGGSDLFDAFTRIPYFDKETLFPESGVATLSARIEVKHRYINAGLPWGEKYPVGVGLRFHCRHSPSQSGLSSAPCSYVPNAYSAGNITYDGHYFGLIIPSISFNVNAGWYRWEAHLTAHADAGTMNGADGAATLNRKESPDSDYNFVCLRFDPGISIET